MGNFARTDRIGQQIQREIAELVRLEINDPRVRLVTITGVEVAGDHSHAKIFFTRLDGKHEEALQGLESASGFLRKQLARSIKLRIMPQLHFGRQRSAARRKEAIAINPKTAIQATENTEPTEKNNWLL